MKENLALKKSVGIWIRVSTDDQAKGDSPEHHEERARAYAKSRGWNVKEIYDLAGQSGKAVMQHPECKRMMKDIERGHISGLIFSKLARLSRNRRELEDFSDYFNKHEADLISLSEAIDTSTAGGRMFFHLLGVFAQWEREEIMEEQLKAWKKPGKAATHLFSGLAYCSCGNKMYVNARTPKYFCRKCNNKIPIVDLENILREELKGFFSQPERIGKHLAEADRNLSEKSALLEAHRGEIQKIKDEIGKTHKLYLADQISVEGFGAIAKPAEQRLSQLQTELPKLEAEVDFLRVNKLSAADVMHESDTMYEQWPTLPSEDKRKVMEALVEKVTIGNGEIDITFSCLPSSEDVCKNQQRLGAG